MIELRGSDALEGIEVPRRGRRVIRRNDVAVHQRKGVVDVARAQSGHETAGGEGDEGEGEERGQRSAESRRRDPSAFADGSLPLPLRGRGVRGDSPSPALRREREGPGAKLR